MNRWQIVSGIYINYKHSIIMPITIGKNSNQLLYTILVFILTRG